MIAHDPPQVATVTVPTLIGIAEYRSGAAPERIAIFADGTEPLMARVHDRILGQFSIRAIGTDAVELVDAISHRSYVLVLR